MVFHNNFIDNYQQARGRGYNLDGGYPTGGNYWNTYADVDLYSGPYQSETGSDGIWDKPYLLSYCTDRYPLVDPWTGIYRRMTVETRAYKIFINETSFNALTESNMTITSLDLNVSRENLTVNASGHIGCTDFLNITIPKQMLDDQPSTSWIINIAEASPLQTRITENTII